MKAADFDYERPDTLQEALTMLRTGAEAMPLAGGQSLMPMMNFRLARPELLIDLNGLSELTGISISEGTVRIGAMTRYAELETSDLIRQNVPLFGRALPHIAHEAIRNRGTIGGSVALADPAAEMPALLLALAATVVVQGPNGERHVGADDFFQGMYETDLNEDELVTAVLVPACKPADRFGFYELARRHGDYAMVGVACAETSAGVRIAFFSVADCAVRATSAEDILTKNPLDIEAAKRTLEEVAFDGDLNAAAKTKRHLAKVILRRAWEAR